MSPALRTFLSDWLAWVERGAPEGEPYKRGYSLCWNFEDYEGELKDLFGAEDLCRVYPFGRGDFQKRLDSDTQHECPKRLAWVRKMLAEHGETVS